MSAKPVNKERLEHIIEAIDRIFRFTDKMTFESFTKNEMAQFAIIKNFEIIGEAAYQIDNELKESNPEIEWRKIAAFRHILVHDYYKINMEIVWNAKQNKLEDLKLQIEEILDRL